MHFSTVLSSRNVNKLAAILPPEWKNGFDVLDIFLLLFSKNINYNKDSIPLRSIIEKTADIILTLEVLIQH